jgi:diguanylate cyclase (GGDEF)-like protein/PAS domain S-box-containing protein
MNFPLTLAALARCCIALCLLSLHGLVLAAPVLVTDAAQPMISATPYLDYLEDPEGTLDLARVSAPAAAGQFRPLPGTGHGDINLGYSHSAFWLRMTLDSSGQAGQSRLLEVAFSTLDHIELYTPTATGWQRRVTGDRYPFSSRPSHHLNFVFPIPLSGEPQTFYLRIKSEGTLTVPIRLWQTDAYDEHEQRSHTGLALYFGLMLALLLYNLMLYVSLRDRNYLIYVCFNLGMVIGQLSLSGMGSQYVWREWPMLGNITLPMGFALAGMFGALFVQSFLNTRERSPHNHRVISVFVWIFGAIVLAALWLPYQWSAILVSLCGAIFPVFALSSGVISLRHGDRSARFFLISWLMPLLGTSVLGLRNLGWVPTNFFSLYALMIGSALEMLLLSFALADRIHLLRREKEEAQSNVIFAIGNLLRSVINAIPDFIFYKDRHGVFLGCNQAFGNLHGKTEQEIIGRTGFDLVPPEKAREFQAQDECVLISGEPLRHEEFLTHADGRLLFVEQSKWPLRDASGQVVGLVGIVRDMTERHRQAELERFRNRIFELLAYNGSLPLILDEIVRYVEQVQDGLIATILLLDQEGKHLHLGAACSLPGFITQAIDGLEVREGNTPCGTAAFRNQRVVTEDLQTDPAWAPYRELAELAALRSCWSEPIHSVSGEVLGTFAIYRHSAGLPGADATRLVQQAATLASIAIEHKRAEDTIWRQANYDTVTHLPNRRLFRDRLDQELRRAQREQRRLALLFIDLDRFKDVNDTLGHDAGDALLVEAARRIAQCVRETDTAARIGGDEFTVIMPQLLDTRRVEEVAQALVDALARPFQLGQEVIYLSASLGITLYPDDAEDAESLLQHADQAMYVAKNRGRNGYSYFTGEMQEHALRRQAMTRDLRVALENNEFRLYFQPIVDMLGGQIVKAEALIRWQHPQRGLVSPMEFIPLAEEVGLIGAIGDWVWRESLIWMKRWHSRGASCRQVSVNMSPNQFIGEACSAWLAQLRQTGLPGECLVIEITEGLLLNERTGVTDKLAQFRAAGVQIAVDDFGTGYSALAYLKKFEIDFLKIDRSFVRDLATDPNDLALSEAIIVMAHSLGLSVVAEGVETIEQRDILAAAGCNYAQGYLYAQPLPAEAFDALLAQSPSHEPDRAAESSWNSPGKH